MSKPNPAEIPSYRVADPAEAFERLKAGVKQAMSVSKPEIVRLEEEAKKARHAHRHGKNRPL